MFRFDCISTLPTSRGAGAENYRCESYGAIEPQPQQTGADKPHIGLYATPKPGGSHPLVFVTGLQLVPKGLEDSRPSGKCMLQWGARWESVAKHAKSASVTTGYGSLQGVQLAVRKIPFIGGS